jgi:TRAP-type mannitol/chloroaromatic compound transport system permease small subunit
VPRYGGAFPEAAGMKESTPQLLAITAKIDRFTDAIGLAVAWLNIPLVLAVAYEVTSRYVFNTPTIWAFDVTYMLYSAVFMLGAAYALHKGAHIRTDFFFESWSTRTKGLIDSIAYLVFFFPALILFFIVGAEETWSSFIISETSEQTPWRPLLWPFKLIVPVACLLLIVQGVSETIKSIYASYTGIELEHKEKVEI